MPKLHTKLIMIMTLICIGAIGSAVFFYRQYQLARSSSAAPARQAQAIIEEVGHLMFLPADEEPTVATVSDVQKLKYQHFFSSAQNGDELLIYAIARKAILYRPSSNKIVDVAPININPIASPSASQEQSSP